MTEREALKLALEALETSMYPQQKQLQAITAIKEALAQPEQEPVAAAWDKGYQQGVQDERTSEANIGIAGFGAKVQPARQNPYGITPPPVSGTHKQEPVAYWDDEKTFVLPKQKEWDRRTGGISTFGCDTPVYTTPPQRTWVGLTDDEQQEAYEKWQNDGWGVFYNAIEAKLKQKNGYAEEKNT